MTEDPVAVKTRRLPIGVAFVELNGISNKHPVLECLGNEYPSSRRIIHFNPRVHLLRAANIVERMSLSRYRFRHQSRRVSAGERNDAERVDRAGARRGLQQCRPRPLAVERDSAQGKVPFVLGGQGVVHPLEVIGDVGDLRVVSDDLRLTAHIRSAAI